MAELQRRGAQAVLVTSGNGKVLLAANGRTVAFNPERVEQVVNPIGCGDCLAAGAAWALGHGADIETAVRQGLALAAENMRTLLPSDFDGRRLKLQHR